MRVLLSLLLCLCCCLAEELFLTGNDYRVRLTAERGGPPSGAQFVPIPVINLPQFASKPVRRPFKGRPPPPPPTTTQRPTKRPRPTTAGPLAPQPLPVPSPVNQAIPQVSQEVQGTATVPPLPQEVTLVTPAQGVRPDLETVAPTPPPPLTTTPATMDSAPALYQRFIQNEDGSYYFDFLAANTISRSEQGFFKRDNFYPYPVHVKTGKFSFTSPEGVPFRVDYIADERGYRAFSRLVFPSGQNDLQK